MSPRPIVIVIVLACAAGLAACGGSSSSGPPTLTWYHFPENSGSFAAAAKACTQQAGGAYKIAESVLPSDADSQRQQLVRRLAAKDSSIDIIAMDVVWTPEFAEAGWIKPWSGAPASQVTDGVLPGPIKTATWRGKLFAAPFNSNTQLLWYRKDLVKTPPKTWAEMIAAARTLAQQGKPHYIEIQGRQYEGLTVWFNTLIQSAGGEVLKSLKQVSLGPPAVKAAEVMHDLANSPAADPSLSNQQEDQNRLGFESGKAAFELNYPFVYPSAKQNAPKIFKNMGYALYPSVEAGKPARVSIGGSNLGVASYSKHPQQAFAAVACLRGEENQKVNAIKGGLPPVTGKLYDDPALAKDYPFHELIKRELANAAVRPQTPAYSDVSLAIQKALSPPASVDPRSAENKLKDLIGKALSSGALI